MLIYLKSATGQRIKNTNSLQMILLNLLTKIKSSKLFCINNDMQMD